MNYKMKKLAAMKLIEKMDEIDPDAIKAFSISIMLEDDSDKESFKPHKMYDEEGEEHDADTYEKHMKMKKMGYKHKDEEHMKMKKMDCKEDMEDA